MNRDEKNRKRLVRRVLLTAWSYLAFFLLIAFVITCCLQLFLNSMARETGIVLTREGIQHAAKLTFANVLLLSLLCTVIDALRRRITVERPVRQLVEAADKIKRGDFSVRVPSMRRIGTSKGFEEIGNCFNQMAAELSGIETLRTDFISNVSHELKTPLAVIRNYGTMLQQPGLPEEERLEYAKAITEASCRLANLISNILKLNKLESQQIFPEAQTYDLGEQLCECLLGFENAWEEKNLEIETEIEENVLVRTDAEMLTLVWNNLFSNAVKFTDPGGTVSLKLKTEGEFAVVSVSDTGCGIRPEVGRHMFEKFYQGDTSHAAEGNGLGLALVKRVVDIIGGEISVVSEVGKGSTFTVKVRRADDGEVQKDPA